MSNECLSQSERARILSSAALLFAVGLIVGLVFTFKAIGHVVVWPVIPSLDIQMPGTEVAWRKAHLGVMVNALAMMLFATAGGSILLGPKERRFYALCVQVTGWGNSIAFVIAAAFSARGLAFGHSAANSLVYFLFLLAAGAAFGQAWLLWRGAMAGNAGMAVRQ